MLDIGDRDNRTLGLRQSLLKISRRGLLGTIRYMMDKGLSGTAETIGFYCRMSRAKWINRCYDKRFCVDTGAGLSPSQLATHSANLDDAEIYTPMPEKTFHAQIAPLELNTHEYTFVDFGSGKGKVLLMASDYPFKKILGVEFASNLHEVALSNLANYRSEKQQCSDLHPLLEDASTFSIPPGPCLLFFYAPFQGQVLVDVLENIRRSIVASPRPLVILFFDDDVPDALITQVDETIEAWGLMKQAPIEPFPYDPGAPVRLTGTLWRLD